VEAGNIMDRVIILNGRPYDTIDKVIKAQILPWMALDTRYTHEHFLTHYRYSRRTAFPRCASPTPRLAEQAGPMLLDKAEEYIKRLIMAKPSEFDADVRPAPEGVDGHGRQQVKDDMLAQYDREHK